MRRFHLTKYTVFRPDFYKRHSSAPDPLKLVVISDIHFSYLTPNQKLNSLRELIRQIDPSYVLIPGDLIDSLPMVSPCSERERLFQWLTELGKTAKVLIALGNHDFYEKQPNRKGSKLGRVRGWRIKTDDDFLSQLGALPNVYLLDNAKYEDENLYVFGFTFSPEYYNLTDKVLASPFNPNHEKKDQMIKEINVLDPKLIHHLPSDKAKFALIHSPVYLADPEVTDLLQDFDYFISGHMHNGIMPPVLDELISNDRGLLAPSKKLFPKNSRRTFKSYQDKLMVFSSVTVFHECTGKLHYLNALYPSYLGEIDLTNDQSYASKPGVEYKYLKLPRIN